MYTSILQLKRDLFFSVESILLRKTFCGKLGPPFGKLDPLFDYRVLYLGSKLPIFISKIAVLGSHFHESSSPFGKRGLQIEKEGPSFGKPGFPPYGRPLMKLFLIFFFYI